MRSKTIHLATIFTAMVLLVVSFALTDVQATSVQNATGYVNSRIGVNVREGTATSTRKVMGLGHKKKVTITEVVFTSKNKTTANTIWYRVSANGKSGYIRSDFVNGVQYSAVTGRTTDVVNYRTGASADMKKKGTFGKDTGLTVLLTAKAKGSSVNWYLVRYNGSEYYVCSSWVSITGSIFSENPSTEPETPSENPGGQGGTTAQPSEFEQTIAAFPEEYKGKLRALHNAHPNWRFVAKDTGVDWNTAVSKESANGVSLIYHSYPLSYRDMGSNSFRPSGTPKTLYRTASASASAVTTLSAGTNFTVLDEVFVANSNSDDNKFVHVRLSDGKEGYLRNTLSEESYSTVIGGNIKGGTTNIRSGAGTNYQWIKSLANGTRVDIVLSAKASDGKTWYKIRNGVGYAYICGDFVALAKVEPQAEPAESGVNTGTAKAAVDYRMGPGTLFASKGSLKSGDTAEIVASVRAEDKTLWYQLNIGGKLYFAPADQFNTSAEVKEGSVGASGTTTGELNYRASAGMGSKPVSSFSKGTALTVTGAVQAESYTWYRISHKGTTYYVASNWVDLKDTAYSGSSSSAQPKQQEADPSKLTGSGCFRGNGTYIPKDGSTWFNASGQVVAYYMDPRNFLDENGIYQFEDLAYQPYQSTAAVSKVLAGTKLASNGFLPSWFVGAGQTYGMSPIALAARARQETGNGSIAISGWSSGGSTYYNPYNIGAYSGANPVMNGMNYAKNAGWDTKEKAVYGGAKFIAQGYINKGQNTVYFQKFNVANGASKVATHQYMTNVTVGYTESLSTKASYSAYGITEESLVFMIPVYRNMPSSTSLPG